MQKLLWRVARSGIVSGMVAGLVVGTACVTTPSSATAQQTLTNNGFTSSDNSPFNWTFGFTALGAGAFRLIRLRHDAN